VHQQPVPRIGGVAIFLSAMCVIGSVLLLSDAVDDEFRLMLRQLTTLLCSATFIFLIGLADDLRGLPARFKFLAELAAAGSLCFVGVRISSIAIADGIVVHLGGWGSWLTLLWVVGITNAVNLSDGLDGLAAGVCAVACGVIAVFAIHYGDMVLAALMLALAGSLSGFLLFNFNPAKVFMGDCGSLFLGFTIAASSVLCVAKSAALVGLTLPALALGIPIFDTLFSMLRRYLERRSLFAPDRGHFHHRLLDLGLHQRHAVIVIYLATVLASGLGLFMLVRKDLGSLVVFGCVLLLIVLLFRVVGIIHIREILARLQGKYASSRQEGREKRTFESLQLRLRQVRTAEEHWQVVCQAAQQLDFARVCLRAPAARVSRRSGPPDSRRVLRPDASATQTRSSRSGAAMLVSADGRAGRRVWRRTTIPAGFNRIMTMRLPITAASGGRSVELEIAVLVNGSLESATHRAGLFIRLMDEFALGYPP
jgi:UDP-GlcNAc:undecaprenyl-phosphate GlcNAc-1-phosphate transferase